MRKVIIILFVMQLANFSFESFTSHSLNSILLTVSAMAFRARSHGVIEQELVTASVGGWRRDTQSLVFFLYWLFPRWLAV